MIGVDTNILARLFVEDNPSQTESARRLFASRPEGEPIFISAVVIAEFVWLLTSRYRYPVTAAHKALAALFASTNVAVEHEDIIKAAVAEAELSGCDIADMLISTVAALNGCNTVMTFDKAAARRVPGMELLA